MIYLDYSASTPVDKSILDSFNRVCLEFPGNGNSLHSLGSNINSLVNDATKQIKDILKININDEIIYTSGSTEANNLALLGVCKDNTKGMHIITSKYEHSSIKETLSYLESRGYIIDYVNNLSNGLIDLDHLKSLLNDKVLLVTISHVNSELGLIQDLNKIGKLIKDNGNALFHSDLTQSMGKVKLDLSYVDMASASSHKFYGLKGIGILYKKKNIHLNPQIHGGKSTTMYRSGTPAHPLIASFSKALRLAYNDIDSKYKHILELNKYLVQELSLIDGVYVNSNEYCIPHILNISVVNVKPESLMHALSMKDIFISTKSACSSDNSLSDVVLELTKNEILAKSSIRISLSHLTKREEIDIFIKELKNCYQELLLRN